MYFCAFCFLLACRKDTPFALAQNAISKGLLTKFGEFKNKKKQPSQLFCLHQIYL